MDLDLQCVASFLVLREEGHFGRASARLHLTSPALTKRIQKLERDVGVPLVTRTPGGGTVLTAAGWRFAEHAVVALERARSAQEAAREAARTRPHTVVRIGVPGAVSSDSMLHRVVAGVVSHQAQVPGVSLRVVALPFDAFLQAVLGGAIDILWSPSPIRHPELLSRAVGTGSRVGVVARGHPLAALGSTTAERFAELPLLFSRALPPEVMTPGTLGDIRPLGEAHLVHTAAQGFGELRADVALGRGAVVVPDVLATGLGPRLVAVALTGLAPTQVYAVHRRSDLRPLLREVIDVLTAQTEVGSAPHPGEGHRSVPGVG